MLPFDRGQDTVPPSLFWILDSKAQFLLRSSIQAVQKCNAIFLKFRKFIPVFKEIATLPNACAKENCGKQVNFY
jgi:hypothetical protein